mgnify:CR=1 FL=1
MKVLYIFQIGLYPSPHLLPPFIATQAVEVCKLLGRVGDVLVKKLLLYDALSGECCCTLAHTVVDHRYKQKRTIVSQ